MWISPAARVISATKHVQLWLRVERDIPENGLDRNEAPDSAVDVPCRDGEHEAHVHPCPVYKMHQSDEYLLVRCKSGDTRQWAKRQSRGALQMPSASILWQTAAFDQARHIAPVAPISLCRPGRPGKGCRGLFEPSIPAGPSPERPSSLSKSPHRIGSRGPAQNNLSRPVRTTLISMSCPTGGQGPSSFLPTGGQGPSPTGRFRGRAVSFLQVVRDRVPQVGLGAEQFPSLVVFPTWDTGVRHGVGMRRQGLRPHSPSLGFRV